MSYNAFIRDEGVDWFVYVEQPHAQTSFACRFGRRGDAERIAKAMNDAWRSEGRHYSDFAREREPV